MTRTAGNLKPRREFLRLAAFTGAAALTGKGVAAADEQNAGPQAEDSHGGMTRWSFFVSAAVT
jgi:nitrous oxide reductase